MQAVILEEIGDGTTLVNGEVWMNDARGGMMPASVVKPADKLNDETVRKIVGFALDLSAQIERFKAHTMADLSALDALLEQDYGVVKAGNRGKGNRSYISFDGCLKVSVQVADFIDFGPELQIAKTLIDECLNEWSAGSRPEIQAIVTKAFNTDRAGQINRAEIFMLLRLDIEDERWLRAMAAIRDAMRVVGRKEYVRFETRPNTTSKFEAITINLAKA